MLVPPMLISEGSAEEASVKSSVPPVFICKGSVKEASVKSSVSPVFICEESAEEVSVKSSVSPVFFCEGFVEEVSVKSSVPPVFICEGFVEEANGKSLVPPAFPLEETSLMALVPVDSDWFPIREDDVLNTSGFTDGVLVLSCVTLFLKTFSDLSDLLVKNPAGLDEPVWAMLTVDCCVTEEESPVCKSSLLTFTNSEATSAVELWMLEGVMCLLVPRVSVSAKALLVTISTVLESSSGL